MNFDFKEAKDCVNSCINGHKSILASGSKKRNVTLCCKIQKL